MSERYAGGGMNRHMTSHVPNSFCRMHTCMRPSFETRIGKSRGTTAVPSLDVTTNWGGPLVGIKRLKASTGAQSWPLQHSFGYQLCAGAGVGQVPASIEQAIRANGSFFIVDTRDGLIAASFHAAGARASYIHMRCDSCCAGELGNVDRRGRILEQIKQLGLLGGAGFEEDMLQMRARRHLTDPEHRCGILDPEAWGNCQ